MILRIHGDNIIECERTLKLIELAYNARIVLKSQNIFMPSYSAILGTQEVFEIQLLGGHNRWDVNFNLELAKNGAPLREATDAYVTRVSSDNNTEELLLAMDYFIMLVMLYTIS